jgi:hypothetical protein
MAERIDRSICVYCGKRADPRLGGRPKCEPCMWTLIGGFVLSVVMLGLWIWAHHG